MSLLAKEEKIFQFQNDLDQQTEIENYIHIRLQPQGKRVITSIQGLPQDLNFEKVIKEFKKKFACNGWIAEDNEKNKTMQLQGDQRKVVLDFLVSEKICKKNSIKIHGA